MERSKGGNVEMDSYGSSFDGQSFDFFQKSGNRKIFVYTDVQGTIFGGIGFDKIFQTLL
jgi:hypothetical protein